MFMCTCGLCEFRWKVLEIEPNYDFNKTMNELLESSREKVNVFKESSMDKAHSDKWRKRREMKKHILD